MIKLLLHHINKIDDAIINCTVDLEALLHNLRNGGAPCNIGQAKTSCKMGRTSARKQNTCSLPGLMHTEWGSLSRQNLPAALVKTRMQLVNSMHSASLQLTSAWQRGRLKPGLQQPWKAAAAVQATAPKDLGKVGSWFYYVPELSGSQNTTMRQALYR